MNKTGCALIEIIPAKTYIICFKNRLEKEIYL